jgi:hypothetical protein
MSTSNVSSKTVGFHQANADASVSTVAQRIGCSEADAVPANMPALKAANDFYTEEISPADADGAVTTAAQKENENRAPKRSRDPPQRERIPFHERVGCSVADAVEASGQSRSRLYEKMNSGKLAFWKDGKHRIVSVQSLLALKD